MQKQIENRIAELSAQIGELINERDKAREELAALELSTKELELSIMKLVERLHELDLLIKK